MRNTNTQYQYQYQYERIPMYVCMLNYYWLYSNPGIRSFWWHVRLCFQTPAKTHPSYSADTPPTSPSPSSVFPTQLPVWSEWYPAPSPWLAAYPIPYLRTHVAPPSNPMKERKKGGVSPAASPIISSSIIRGEHRAVSTSSGSVTAVLSAATLPVPYAAVE